MKKNIFIILYVLFLILLGISLFFLGIEVERFRNENTALDICEPPYRIYKGDFEETEISSLKDYQKSIDYSCNTDDDCVAKDVHNCCGYYPECVNSKIEVQPDLVNDLCEKEGLSSDCGFESISGCKCVSGKCDSFYDEKIGETEILK